jgi:CRISPR/Cas system CSM-associated protein Csm2 small subunit
MDVDKELLELLNSADKDTKQAIEKLEKFAEDVANGDINLYLDFDINMNYEPKSSYWTAEIEIEIYDSEMAYLKDYEPAFYFDNACTNQDIIEALSEAVSDTLDELYECVDDIYAASKKNSEEQVKVNKAVIDDLTAFLKSYIH